MFKGLIDYLTFGYSFICKGRGKLKPSEMMMIQGGADVAVRHAEEVLAEGQQLTKDDKLDLEEARKIYEHVEEMSVFLQSLEII